MLEPVNFYSMTQEDLKSFFKRLGKEQFRAQQIYKWVYDRKVTDLDQMSNLSKTFRDEFKPLLKFDLPKIVTHLKSIDGTQKFLFDMKEGNTVEAVLIPSDDRLTLCVSSEIGCNIGCKFCFTGKQKLKRRLNTEEIVGQFIAAEATLPEGTRITNIVFMGMGEPLDNPEAVFKTIDILHEPFGRNFSRRKVTVSTSGLVPEMWRVAEAKARLAVSLNGYNDEVRTQVMPINKKYPIKMLMDACREHYQKTRDHITFEYVLLKGVTDSIEAAHALYKLTRSVPCKINIIPFNEHPGSGFVRPSSEAVKAFQDELISLGAHVLLRKTMGRDIYAACGQLTSAHDKRPQKIDISKPFEEQVHV